jgi:aconitate hydratase 2/2-methylisocitrate dehydratase
VAGAKIDEVFIGSCMTNIGHFRAAGKLLEKVEGGSLSTRLWLAPPTKMDEHQLMEEGYYNIYGRAGARTEMPGCSLCMGNQARVAPNTTCVSTSTRNFPNRLGQGANVYLASAELARLPRCWASCRPWPSTWSTPRRSTAMSGGYLPLPELRQDR